jgi:hypothetical protein
MDPNKTPPMVVATVFFNRSASSAIVGLGEDVVEVVAGGYCMAEDFVDVDLFVVVDAPTVLEFCFSRELSAIFRASSASDKMSSMSNSLKSKSWLSSFFPKIVVVVGVVRYLPLGSTSSRLIFLCLD